MRAMRAASMAGVPLIVAGTGPAEGALRELAGETGTTMLGYVDDAKLNDLIGNARAAILPGEEDFGLVPLEAAAAGAFLVVALSRSGGRSVLQPTGDMVIAEGDGVAVVGRPGRAQAVEALFTA